MCIVTFKRRRIDIIGRRRTNQSPLSYHWSVFKFERIFFWSKVEADSSNTFWTHHYMTSRMLPWRAKPTTEESALIDRVSSVRFFLVREIGPTQFVIKDETGSRFKISIGSIQKCACNNKNELCLHLLYVMLKLLRVPADSPLLIQRSLTDSEIGQILRSRDEAKSRRVGGCQCRRIFLCPVLTPQFFSSVSTIITLTKIWQSV